MPIVIKELFSSDPLSEVLEKVNFNFDQIVLAGGGPPGPTGPQGVPGIPGPFGERGDHWQVGATAPTMDHGPNFGDLKDYDFWLDDNGEVFYWDAGSTSWLTSGVNLVGPTGSVGPTGGSFEFSYYHGKTGNIQSGLSGQANYVPDITVGPTTIPSGQADFMVQNNANKTGFFLGDPTWAYNYLNNFNIIDLTQGNLAPPLASSQRLNPKLTLIQTGIDFTGLGGFSIGAYGATSSTGATAFDFIGLTGATTDARNFFNAGFAINQSLGPIYNHYFKAGTRSIDFELFAGDIFNTPSLGLSQTPNLRLLTTNGGSTIISGVTGPRLTVGNSLSRFNTDLAVGHSSNPTFDTGSTFDNFGKGRSRGDFYIGNLDAGSNYLGIGYGRILDGSANITFYANGSTPTTPTFSINRASGANGIALIEQTGTGPLSILSGSYITLIGNNTNGSIRFVNSLGAEISRIDTVNQRVGILTTSPQEALQVGGNIHVSGGDRTIFNRDVNYLAFGTSNLERIRILSSGLVGINTTTPSDQLEVGNGNIAINDSVIASAGIGRGIKFENGTSDASSINLYRGSASNNLGLSFINSLAGVTGEAMRIQPTGWITIGPLAHSASPVNSRFFIQDNTSTPFGIRSSNSTLAQRNHILFQRSNSTSPTPNAGILGGLSFGGWDGTNWSSENAEITSYSAGLWTLTSKPTYISFFTTPTSSTTATERLRIKEDGKIYIGSQTSALGFDIEIQGTSDKTIGLANSSSGNGWDLNVRSGYAGSGADADGGDLNLYMGQGRGSGGGAIRFFGLGIGSVGTGILRTYDEKAFMDADGFWSIGHTTTPGSRLDVSGAIRIRNSSVNNSVLSNGLRLNSTDNNYEAEIRPYQGSDNARLGISFRTTNATTTSTERFRIFPDGSMKIMDDVKTLATSYIVNSGTTGTSSSLITFMSFPSVDYDRVVYINTDAQMQYIPTYPQSGTFYAQYVIENTVTATTIKIKEILIDTTSRMFTSDLAHSFILPAGFSFDMRGWKNTLVMNLGGSVTVYADWIRLGMQ
jgi:hypothetical protein